LQAPWGEQKKDQSANARLRDFEQGGQRSEADQTK
jgi:hypothetical protein